MGFSRKVKSRERNHFRECLFSTHPEQDLQLVTHTYDARLSRIKVREDERYSLLPLECIISVSVRQFIAASQLKASGPNSAQTTTHLVHSSFEIPRRLRSCPMPSDKIHDHHMNKNVDASPPIQQECTCMCLYTPSQTQGLCMVEGVCTCLIISLPWCSSLNWHPSKHVTGRPRP